MHVWGYVCVLRVWGVITASPSNLAWWDAQRVWITGGDTHTESPTLQPPITVTQVLLLMMFHLPDAHQQPDLQGRDLHNILIFFLFHSPYLKQKALPSTVCTEKRRRRRAASLEEKRLHCWIFITLNKSTDHKLEKALSVTGWLWNIWIFVLAHMFPLDLQKYFSRDWLSYAHVHRLPCLVFQHPSTIRGAPCPPVASDSWSQPSSLNNHFSLLPITWLLSFLICMWHYPAVHLPAFKGKKDVWSEEDS